MEFFVDGLVVRLRSRIHGGLYLYARDDGKKLDGRRVQRHARATPDRLLPHVRRLHRTAAAQDLSIGSESADGLAPNELMACLQIGCLWAGKNAAASGAGAAIPRPPDPIARHGCRLSLLAVDDCSPPVGDHLFHCLQLDRLIPPVSRRGRWRGRTRWEVVVVREGVLHSGGQIGAPVCSHIRRPAVALHGGGTFA